jgi:hypothetical protein
MQLQIICPYAFTIIQLVQITYKMKEYAYSFISLQFNNSDGTLTDENIIHNTNALWNDYVYSTLRE